jgi:hypothetical protein
MEQAEYDDLLRRLTTLIVKMDERLDAQEVFNRQQVAINQDLAKTLARVETLLARMIRTEDNGRDA